MNSEPIRDDGRYHIYVDVGRDVDAASLNAAAEVVRSVIQEIPGCPVAVTSGRIVSKTNDMLYQFAPKQPFIRTDRKYVDVFIRLFLAVLLQRGAINAAVDDDGRSIAENGVLAIPKDPEKFEWGQDWERLRRAIEKHWATTANPAIISTDSRYAW